MQYTNLLPPFLLLATLPARVLGADILATTGYTSCLSNATIQVNALNIQFDRTTKTVVYDVSGTSDLVQNVTASIIATAYGKQVYQRSFNPCDSSNYVKELCPVPAGTFAASGTQVIPTEYLNLIPSIAFTIPDLDGEAQLVLTSADNQSLACIQSSIGNGKTMDIPAVKYVVAGIAAGALAVSAVSALAGAGAAGGAGVAAPSPTFGEVFGWFQTISTSGMLSVKYPSVYQSFTRNFAFSTGLVSWGPMQTTIDSFRKATGGNLTEDSYAYLKNVTVVSTTSTNSTTSSLLKRTADSILLYGRDVSTTVNGTTVSGSNSTSNSTSTTTKEMHYVHGIQAYVEQLMVPQANTFMTVLLVFAIIVAAITVLILLGKVILEAVALGSKLPKSLESWRKRYWLRLAKTITNLILLLYGTWTLYCVYQFTDGDSWAAKALAATTWGIFTALLLFYSFRIWSRARQFKKLDGDSAQLFDNKETWIKYSLFYDSFRHGYWWLFIPAILYMFARNAVIAGANGHGMVQAIGQLSVEALMLILLVWSRPYQLKSGNIINIVIQVVRVLSVVCILVFVEELGINQTTQTITGVILIVVQSVLTGVLGILLAANAIMACVKENPHRRRRKDAEKMARDRDTLTPLGARNSLLMADYKGAHEPVVTTKSPLVASSLTHSPASSFGNPHDHYDPIPARDYSPPSKSRTFGMHAHESHENLVRSAASFSGRERSSSPQAKLPNVGFGRAY